MKNIKDTDSTNLIPSLLKSLVTGVLFLFLFFPSIVFAQDFHLSQYDALPMFLNPAMTGMFDGEYRVNGQYRTQWAAVATKPYTTSAISFDMPVKKFGVGLQIMNYRAGAGSYNVASALLSVAYDVVFDRGNNHHLALGAQGGILQKSVDVSALTFGNQYIGANGGSFDASLASGENISNSSFTVSDFNAGALYYYAKESSRLNPFIGFSAFHLTQPNESFMGTNNKLPMEYFIHGGVKINVNEKIQLLPKFIYMNQLNSQEFTASLLLHYFMKEADSYLIFGPTYRSNDAAIIEVGIKKGKYIARVSYDVNTSSLKTASSSHGGFEISLTYVAHRKKPNPLANCPRL